MRAMLTWPHFATMSEFRWEETNDALRHRGLDPIAMSASTGLTFHDAVSTSNVESEDDAASETKEPKDVVVMEKKSLAAIQVDSHGISSEGRKKFREHLLSSSGYWTSTVKICTENFR